MNFIIKTNMLKTCNFNLSIHNTAIRRAKMNKLVKFMSLSMDINQISKLMILKKIKPMNNLRN